MASATAANATVTMSIEPPTPMASHLPAASTLDRCGAAGRGAGCCGWMVCAAWIGGEDHRELLTLPGGFHRLGGRLADVGHDGVSRSHRAAADCAHWSVSTRCSGAGAVRSARRASRSIRPLADEVCTALRIASPVSSVVRPVGGCLPCLGRAVGRRCGSVGARGRPSAPDRSGDADQQPGQSSTGAGSGAGSVDSGSGRVDRRRRGGGSRLPQVRPQPIYGRRG